MSNDAIHNRGTASQSGSAEVLLSDRTLLRLSATVLLAGELLSVLAGILHPGREDPNNHSAVFTEYAASGNWTAVHLGQFVGMALIIAGLLVLFHALNAQVGTPGWANRFGAVAAVVALAPTVSLGRHSGSSVPASKITIQRVCCSVCSAMRFTDSKRHTD